MKRKIIIILAVLVVLCIISSALIIFAEGSNRKIIANEIFALFKPTVYLDIPKAYNVNKIEVVGGYGADGADEKDGESYYYTDKQKIRKIIVYLRTLPVATATYRDLPNRSPDNSIVFYHKDGYKLAEFSLYGASYIKDSEKDKIYICKKSFDLILFDKLF